MARTSLEQEGVKVSWHQVGKKLGIYSYRTADAYREVWKNMLEHSKKEYGLRDIEKLSAEHLKDFLLHQVEKRVSHATFQQYAAASEKLETALNLYANKSGANTRYDFTPAIKEARAEARQQLERFSGSRAYDNPVGLIVEVKDPMHKLAAKMQLESGSRVREISLIRESQLRGITQGPDREPQGLVEIKGKGGKVNLLKLSERTCEELRQVIAEKGQFVIDGNTYRHDLRQAADRSAQQYNGSHGLRWNFARDRFQEVQRDQGLTYEQALVVVSAEMGHVRGDITEHYLK